MIRRLARIAFALVLVLSVATTAFAAGGGKNGTTLAASKTIDICSNPDGNWTYSGEISIWNEGVVDTQGLTIIDSIQSNAGGSFVNVYTSGNLATGEIPAGTTLATATVIKYSFTAAPLAGDIRNSAVITILNHSGSIGTAKGPNPKATWVGEVPPCPTEPGCTYTRGYWGSKPDVVWPDGFSRDALFFNSGLTWQQVLDTAPQGNGYLILAQQYIPAVLNQANGAPVPSGVQQVINDATAFFTGTTTPAAACPLNSSCGTQKTWGGILDTYNNGIYPGGPAHCGDE